MVTTVPPSIGPLTGKIYNRQRRTVKKQGFYSKVKAEEEAKATSNLTESTEGAGQERLPLAALYASGRATWQRSSRQTHW